jgi:carbonic anhydrase/acetyltransferase-like protein (isoleucine patch superfamily)
MIRKFEDKSPTIPGSCYVDPSAQVIGDVVIGENSSVWPLTVIRGDVNIIRIGDNTNIQDGSVLHVSHAGEFNPKGNELHIGNQVSVAHKALVHGCRIGDRCMIGMGSIIMDDAIVEDEVMIGAGSLVPPGKHLKSGFLYLGNPVKQIREITEREREFLVYLADHYVQSKQKYQVVQNS